MRVAVTGAAGFVGQALVDRLLADGLSSRPLSQLIAVDIWPPNRNAATSVPLRGSVAKPSMLATAPDVVFHLQAIPGGAAAADPALGWSVNVEATIALAERLACQRPAQRLVFTSIVGVFGVPLPSDKVNDETLPLPSMSYGTHKLIGEAVLTDLSRRSLIEGLALRLLGTVARPPQKTSHLSAYMSNIFHALAAGERFVAPVSLGATAWFMSVRRSVDNLIHAAIRPAETIGVRRAFNLPVLHLCMAELVDGLASHFGQGVHELVEYAPDAAHETQFGNYPSLHTPIADGLGFKHDGDASALVARALNLDGASQ